MSDRVLQRPIRIDKPWAEHPDSRMRVHVLAHHVQGFRGQNDIGITKNDVSSCRFGDTSIVSCAKTLIFRKFYGLYLGKFRSEQWSDPVTGGIVNDNHLDRAPRRR